MENDKIIKDYFAEVRDKLDETVRRKSSDYQFDFVNGNPLIDHTLQTYQWTPVPTHNIENEENNNNSSSPKDQEEMAIDELLSPLEGKDPSLTSEELKEEKDDLSKKEEEETPKI